MFEMRPSLSLERVGARVEGRVGVVVGAGPGRGVVKGVVAWHVAGEDGDGVGRVVGEEEGGCETDYAGAEDEDVVLGHGRGVGGCAELVRV